MGDFRTLHVGNVASAVTEYDLCQVFAPYGTIANVKLAGDPSMNTRFAFIEFADPASMQAALYSNGLVLAGRSLRISQSKTPTLSKGPSQTPAASQDPYAAWAASQGAGAYGNDPHAAAWAAYYQQQAAAGGGGGGGRGAPSPTGYGGAPPMGRGGPRGPPRNPWQMGPPDMGRGRMMAAQSPLERMKELQHIARTIYCTGIGQVSEQEIANFFSIFGPVTAIRLGGDSSAPTRIAWIEFATEEAARNSFRAMEAGPALGGTVLKISPSRSKIHQPTVTYRENEAPEDVAKKNQLESTLYVCGVPSAMSSQEVVDWFKLRVGGEVVRISLGGNAVHATRFAFLEFENPDIAKLALTQTGQEMNGSKLTISQSRSCIEDPKLSTTTAAPAIGPASVPTAASTENGANQETEAKAKRERDEEDGTNDTKRAKVEGETQESEEAAGEATKEDEAANGEKKEDAPNGGENGDGDEGAKKDE